jgi:membrane dipeptidase
MCSHCGIDYIKKDARNLSDRQLKAVCSKDGLVGIAFTPSFFNSNSSEELVATFRYLKKKIGTDHLAIGSDFDGIIAPKLFPELSEVSQMQNLRNILKKAGYLTREVEKVFSINVEEKLINRLR